MACHQFELPGTDRRARGRRAGRDVPAQQPVRSRRGLGSHLPARSRSRSSTRASGSSWSTATRSPRTAGLGARINTVLQTCFFALAERLPDRRGDRGDQGRDRRRPTASAGETVVDAQLRGRRRRARRRCTRCRAGDGRQRPPPSCRPCPPRRPTFVQRVTAMMLAGQGDLLPVSALPGRRHVPDRHRAVGEAHRSRARSRSGTRRSASTARKCALVCPHAAIRMKVYEPDGARRRPRTASSTRSGRTASIPGSWMTIQVAPDDCTGCGVCVDVCPAHDKRR